MIIQETFVITETDNDLLKAPSRLEAFPRAGMMQIQLSSTVHNANNHAEVTVQLPDGEVPIDGTFITANGYDADDDVLHDDTAIAIELPVQQGGHVLIGISVTGTTRVAVLVRGVFP